MEVFKRDGISRVLGVIAGVLLVLMGVVCFVTPIETYGAITWLIAFALIADGVAKIMVWMEYKRIGVSDVWALVGGIVSAVLGVVLLASFAARIATGVFVAYLASVWILASGIVRTVRSFRMRSAEHTLDARLGTNWELALVSGILMTVLGIFCVFNPVVVMVTIGWGIGASLIMGGIGLIVGTL